MKKVFRPLATTPAVWAGWVLARLGLGWLILMNWEPRGDVFYYFLGVYGDDPTAMKEYPHAGVWPTEILARLTGEDKLTFEVWFCIMCLGLDFLFLALLLRKGRTGATSRRFGAAWFWVFFGTAAGQVFVMRLDLFPALAVAGAAALLLSRPALGSMLLAFATAMKLWPGVLAAGLVGKVTSGRAWARLAAFFGALAALCAVTVVTSGVDRLLSPLTYQTDRGLQIESIAATQYLIQWLHHPDTWRIFYAPSRSFEIDGPGVAGTVTTTSVAMVVLLLAAISWALYHFVMGHWHPRTTVAFFAVMVLGLIVTNKVFSPQYVVWIAPLMAVALRQPFPEFHGGLRGVRTGLISIIAACTVIAAALGTYVYPFHYDFLVKRADMGDPTATVMALAGRNILILIMFLLTLAWLAVETRAVHRGERQEKAASDAVAVEQR